MANAENFSFSIKAQNVEAKFYNKKAVVYVEGDDDLIFWQVFFPSSDFTMKKVNGCKNLEKKIYEIENNGLKCIVACDSDYTSFECSPKEHPLIVRTLSHSIECVMYCPINLNECVKKLSRTIEDKIDNIIQYYEQFGDDIKELVAYDIANNIHKIVGIKITGDSCCRFLKSSHSCHIDRKKVSTYLDDIKTSFDNSVIENILHSIELDKRTMRQITKGHFQTSFVINLIKSLVKQTSGIDVTISGDALYALLVNCPLSCHKECDEVSTIKLRINKALQFIDV